MTRYTAKPGDMCWNASASTYGTQPSPCFERQQLLGDPHVVFLGPAQFRSRIWDLKHADGTCAHTRTHMWLWRHWGPIDDWKNARHLGWGYLFLSQCKGMQMLIGHEGRTEMARVTGLAVYFGPKELKLKGKRSVSPPSLLYLIFTILKSGDVSYVCCYSSIDFLLLPFFT